METKIEIIKGDITKVEAEAVVNAANAQLAPGGGVAGAIHRAAGTELYKECKKLAPIKPGECVITGAPNMSNKYIIHCLGPRYGIDQPEDELLASCYRNALKLADQKDIKSIAFPAISTGAFGFPFKKATPIALKTVHHYLSNKKTNLEKVIFVLFSENDFKICQDIAKDLGIGTKRS